MGKKLIIGENPGSRDLSGVLFDFMAKWKKSIKPQNLFAFLNHENPWNGSFKTKCNLTEEELLQKLRERLLSGEVSFVDFKLFTKKMSHLNSWTSQLEEIRDFYYEVFHCLIPLREMPDNAPIGADKFMYFPREINFSANRIVNGWEQYRNNNDYGKRVDLGLSTCEQLNYAYGASPRDFLIQNVRADSTSYLIFFEQNFSALDTELAMNTTVEYDNYDDFIKESKGITMREGCILALFEWWKTGRYFEAKQPRYLAIPCLGSICEEGDPARNFRPIPIIILSKDAMLPTRASTKRGGPEISLIKDYHVLGMSPVTN